MPAALVIHASGLWGTETWFLKKWTHTSRIIASWKKPNMAHYNWLFTFHIHSVSFSGRRIVLTKKALFRLLKEQHSETANQCCILQQTLTAVNSTSKCLKVSPLRQIKILDEFLCLEYNFLQVSWWELTYSLLLK